MSAATTTQVAQPSPYLSNGAQANSLSTGHSEYQQAAAAAATANAALSRHHTPTPNAATANGRKRRASGQPGSRGVANLTPEQLAKKRANDREAQRAIRERTRNTIEALEHRIRELESQQPFQELQRVVQERDRALAECEELRRRLGAVAGIVGAQQNPSLNELAALTAQQSPLPTIPHPQQTFPQISGPPYEQLHIHPDLRPSGSSSSQPSPTSQTPTTAPFYQAREGALRKWSPSLDQPPNQHYANTNGVQYDQQRPAAAQMGQTNGERLGLQFLLDSTHQHSQPSSSPGDQSHNSPHAQDTPIYACWTNVGPASCPLDSLLVDFHKSRRKMMREGATSLDAIGPEYPAFSSMLHPNSRQRPHPVSALLIDILSKFPDIAQIPEKVAVFYIMFLVMRWIICPCASCYERLPEWCRPVPGQIENSHVAWCDYLPWPHMRRQISLSGRDIKFEDFFVPFTTTLSLNWTPPADCVLISTPSSNPEEPPTLIMNPAFEHHLRILENWTLGSAFATAFPGLIDSTVRIKDS